MRGELGNKIRPRQLNETMDAAVTTEAQPSVEAHQRRRSISHNLAGAPYDCVFQTTAAQRTGRRSVRTDKHACAGPAITRTAGGDKSRERQRFVTTKLVEPKNIQDLFHRGAHAFIISIPPALSATDEFVF